MKLLREAPKVIAAVIIVMSFFVFGYFILIEQLALDEACKEQYRERAEYYTGGFGTDCVIVEEWCVKPGLLCEDEYLLVGDLERVKSEEQSVKDGN